MSASTHSGAGKAKRPRFFFAAAALLFALGAWGALPAGGPQVQSRGAPPKICRYLTWEWNTRTQKSVNHRWVEKPLGEVTGEERDPASRCSVCQADQITIQLEGLPEFRVCKYFAGKVEAALLEIRESGFPIRSVIGYRVGRSRGKTDAEGLRTRFSNHSFGAAIDLNADLNGLYANCLSFGEACRLIRGGHWRPPNPGTLTADSIPVAAFKAIGWKWGGEIAGWQKDFMHFSLTGY